MPRQSTNAVLTRVVAGDADPSCEETVEGRPCGGVLATTIVRFGEHPDPLEMHRAKREARECDLLLCVGSTLTVNPVARLVPLALDYGVRLLIVNGAPTNYDSNAVCLRGDLSDVLPALLVG